MERDFYPMFEKCILILLHADRNFKKIRVRSSFNLAEIPAGVFDSDMARPHSPSETVEPDTYHQ